MTTDEVKIVLDRATLATDLIKHVSTIASSSIILLATFLGRAEQPHDKGTLIWGVSLLMLCIACCSVYLFLYGMRKAWAAATAGFVVTPRLWETMLSMFIFGTFCVGIILVGVSVIRTLNFFSGSTNS